MYLTKKIRQESVGRNTIITLVAIALSTAVAADAFAAGRGGGRAGHAGGAFQGVPQLDAPSVQQPIFNPSSSYTAPPATETPVSPASPGSVFGND